VSNKGCYTPKRKIVFIRFIFLISGLVTFLLLPATAFTQTQTYRLITLKQAIDSALILNKRINKDAIKVDINNHQVKEAEQKMLPDLNFHTGFSVISPLDQFQNGIDKPPVRYPLPWDIYDFSVNGSVPLFMGGKIQNEIKKQKQEVILSKQNLAKETRDEKLRVIEVFLNVYYYMLQTNVIEQNIHEDSIRIKQVQSLKRNGAVTENEVLRAQLQLSNHQLLLISVNNNQAIALHQLKILLEIKDEENIMIDTTQLSNNLFALADYTSCITTALQETDELKLANTQKTICMLNEKMTKGNFYPKISAAGNYGFFHPNFEFFPPTNYAYRLGTLGIDVSFSISNLYKNWQRLIITRKETAWQNEDIKEITEQVDEKVFRAYKNYTEAMQRIGITEQAVLQATENYSMVKNKYLNQLALITDLIDADNTLLETQTNVVAAQTDAKMKYFRLQHIIGKL